MLRRLRQSYDRLHRAQIFLGRIAISPFALAKFPLIRILYRGVVLPIVMEHHPPSQALALSNSALMHALNKLALVMA